MTNAYQRAKARKIATFLERSCATSTVRQSELPKLVSLMTPDQWRTVSFAAGVAVADYAAKAIVLDLLRRKELRVVAR